MKKNLKKNMKNFDFSSCATLDDSGHSLLINTQKYSSLIILLINNIAAVLSLTPF